MPEWWNPSYEKYSKELFVSDGTVENRRSMLMDRAADWLVTLIMTPKAFRILDTPR